MREAVQKRGALAAVVVVVAAVLVSAAAALVCSLVVSVRLAWSVVVVAYRQVRVLLLLVMIWALVLYVFEALVALHWRLLHPHHSACWCVQGVRVAIGVHLAALLPEACVPSQLAVLPLLLLLMHHPHSLTVVAAVLLVLACCG